MARGLGFAGQTHLKSWRQELWKTLPWLEISLPLAEIYEAVTFEPAGNEPGME